MGRTVPGSRPAVLVVEDEPMTRLSAMDMVEAAGCEAIGALNADEAVRVLETRTDILVPRFRSSHHSVARSFANFGIEGH